MNDIQQVEYLQTKIDFFKDTRYLHEDVNDDVCIACDKAISYLETVIINLQEPSIDDYNEHQQQNYDTRTDLENEQI